MRSSIVALALVLLPAAASAQLSKEQIAKAKQHYQAATAADQAGNYDTAISEFNAAYDITKDPKLFFHIAAAHEKAGHVDDALLHYQRFLKEAKVSPQTQAEVEAKMAELEKKRAPEPVAEPAPEPEPLAPMGETTTGATTVETESPDRPGAWYGTAAWVSIGLCAALLTTGGVLATSASSRQEDVERLIEFRDPTTGQPREYNGTTREQYEEAYDEGDALDAYALVAFVAAGATAGLAATFFILDASSDGEEGADSSARLTPIMTPGSAGLAASWRF